MVIIVMGVSGSGKTTIGRRLAERLDGTFHDGDDFHPPANVNKMASGQPLTDADRWPWLRAIRSFIDERRPADPVTVVACSALKQAYRDALMGNGDATVLVYLRGDVDLIQERLETRADHFFDADLLASQFEALEPPAPDDAITVDIDAPPDAIVRTIIRQLPADRLRKTG